MNTDQLIDKAIQAALLAGSKIMEVYSSVDLEIEFKEDQSPITKADRLAHDQIVETLKCTQLPLLSEEGIHQPYAERKNWKLFWLIDPLDGTKEFIKRNNDFTVNIALIRENKAFAGVIYVPVSEEIYVGISGIGAWKYQSPARDTTFSSIQNHGQKLPLQTKYDEFVVMISRSHRNTETEEKIEEYRKIHSDIRFISRGSSLKICMVAEGNADVYPRFGQIMEWDTAAGHAIVKAAGKNIYHADEQTEVTYNKEDLHNPNFIVR